MTQQFSPTGLGPPNFSWRLLREVWLLSFVAEHSSQEWDRERRPDQSPIVAALQRTKQTTLHYTQAGGVEPRDVCMEDTPRRRNPGDLQCDNGCTKQGLAPRGGERNSAWILNEHSELTEYIPAPSPPTTFYHKSLVISYMRLKIMSRVWPCWLNLRKRYMQASSNCFK